MNQKKIGKFISTCRKKKKLTQEQLAEYLGITDRTISKWERGINLPDTSIMLELCNILDINVNELLTGEIIKKDDYMKQAEENLIELKSKIEEQTKQLLNLEIIIGIISITAFIVLLMITVYFEFSQTIKIILSIIALFIFATGLITAMKIEREVGYYECSKCHYKYIPRLIPFWISMHMGRTRYLKCPKCHKYSWTKKVLTK